MVKLDLERLKAFREELRGRDRRDYIKVGMSTCGIAAGADKVYALLKEEIEKRGLAVSLEKCGCLGMCFAEPLVEVGMAGAPVVIYGRVDTSVAHRIIDEHLCCGRIVSDHVYELRRS